MDVKSTWIPNTHNHWLILFYHVWGPAWMDIHWIGIWLRAWSHITSHYTWGSVTTLHDSGGVLRRPLDTFFWALTISWSRLLACVRSGPKQCSRSKSSMPFKHDLALQNMPLSKQPFKSQPQIENEDVTWSPQYNPPTTRTNKRRALSLQEVKLDGWFLILHITLKNIYHI
jgi:hypothetical protein